MIEVTAEHVLAPHIACAEERLRAHPRVLCIQDTTEVAVRFRYLMAEINMYDRPGTV